MEFSLFNNVLERPLEFSSYYIIHIRCTTVNNFAPQLVQVGEKLSQLLPLIWHIPKVPSSTHAQAVSYLRRLSNSLFPKHVFQRYNYINNSLSQIISLIGSVQPCQSDLQPFALWSL